MLGGIQKQPVYSVPKVHDLNLVSSGCCEAYHLTLKPVLYRTDSIVTDA
jgi:hypothetical protein